MLHDEVMDAVLHPDVVERADVRMIQAGDNPGFALEALERSGSSDRCPGSVLIATVRFRRVSTARYTSPMPPAAIRACTS